MSNNDDKPAVDVYGHKNVPDAARFGVGARTLADVQKACDARREVRPGQYREAK